MPASPEKRSAVEKKPESSRRWKVKVDSLTPDAPLTYDLFDDLGKLLVPAGKNVSKSVIDYMLNRGLKWLLIDSNVDVGDPTVAAQIRPYDPQAVDLITQSFEACEMSLDRSCLSLGGGGPVDVKSLESLIEIFSEESQQDVAPLLATTLGRANDPFDVRKQMIDRSVRLSALVVAMGNVLDQSPGDVRALGMAALLGDISLMLPEPLEDIQQARGRLSAARNYLKHPIQSSELTINIKRIPPLSRLLITQIHEELDGHGFPLGLSMARIHPLARILNVADAFLTMVNPIGSQYGILPADAMACLVFHAGEGRLCTKSVKALVQCASMYPVSSSILLENEMKAQVVRACPNDPLKPAVIIEGEGAEIVDLRCCPVRVQMPIAAVHADRIGRLRLSKLSSPIWHLSSSDFVVF